MECDGGAAAAEAVQLPGCRKRKVRVQVQVHGRWSPVRDHAYTERRMHKEHASSTATAANTEIHRKSEDDGEKTTKQKFLL